MTMLGQGLTRILWIETNMAHRSLRIWGPLCTDQYHIWKASASCFCSRIWIKKNSILTPDPTLTTARHQPNIRTLWASYLLTYLEEVKADLGLASGQQQ